MDRPFSHLLVAYDGSGHADRAVDLAAHLAAAFDADLTVLHVVSTGSMVPMVMDAYAELEQLYSTSRDLLEDTAREILARAAERAEARGAPRVSTRLEVGAVARTIVAVADDIPADAIVMGRRGLGDLGGLLLGSVTHKVAHLADRTVVTVR